MSEHNHTGLDEAASVASNTMKAVRTGKAISAAAKGAAAGGPYGAAIGAALSARKHIGENSGGRTGVIGAAAAFYFAPAGDYLWKPDGQRSVRSSRAADPQ